MKNSILIIFLVFGSVIAQAQSFGNEWIDYDNEYYRVRIAENGFYRINRQELQEAGFPVNGITAGNIQVFRRGQEIAINVNSNSGSLNYIEFYAEKNDGRSDTDLFLEGEQGNTGFNLFTDTATYFLTIGTSGKRIQNSGLGDRTGLTPVTYHIQKDRLVFGENYIRGADVEIYTPSFFTKGEGYADAAATRNNPKNYDFDISNFISNSEEVTVKASIYGANNNDHKFELGLNSNDGYSITFESEEFEGRDFKNLEYSLPASNLASADQVTISLNVIDVGVDDRVAMSLLELSYPQTMVNQTSVNRVFNIVPNTENSLVRIEKLPGETYEFFDITNPALPIKLLEYDEGTYSEFVIAPSSSGRTILSVPTEDLKSPEMIGSITKASISNEEEISAIGNDFLIIYHELLNSSDEGFPVNQYAEYRSSSEGGDFNVEVAEIQAVYDQFNYGDPSSIAIRRLLEFGQSQFKYVFIIGKGWSLTRGYYRGGVDSPIQIPTYGVPGSDTYYSAGLLGTESNVPAIPIGRLSARDPQTVSSYLQKVKEHEQFEFDDLWKKDIIQLSGGRTLDELEKFRNYILNYEKQASGDFLGGNIKNQFKTSSDISETFPIEQEVNNGVSLITIFGHSSSTVTDVELGPPEVYDNKGKYPFIIVNGCNAGDIYGGVVTFGEKWTFENSKAGIGFIANVGLAGDLDLNSFTTNFYKYAFEDSVSFGNSVGDIFIKIAKSSSLNSGRRLQILQSQIVADPSIKMFGVKLPDYEFDNNVSIQSFSGQTVFALEDSFKIDLNLNNYGKTDLDSVDIRLIAVYPGGQRDTMNYTVERVLRTDLVSLTFQNRLKTEGNYQFNLFVDPENIIEEIRDNNNQFSFSENIFNANSFNLYPVDRAVIGNNNLKFYWQTVVPSKENIRFRIQISEDPEFLNSELVNTIVESNHVFSYNWNLPTLPDTTVLYWRTSVENPLTPKDSLFAESSFTMIPDQENAAGVFSLNQLPTSSFNGLDVNMTTGELEFEKTLSSLELEVPGTDLYTDFLDLTVDLNGTNMLVTTGNKDPGCRANTLGVMVFDKQTATPIRPIDFGNEFDEANPLICGRLPQVIHNFTRDNLLGSNRYLDLIISLMDNRDRIVLFNFDSVAYEEFDDQLLTSLGEVGISRDQWSRLTGGQPVVIVGEKGIEPGMAKVIDSDGSSNPIKSQTIRSTESIEGIFDKGTLTFPRFGPARNWNALSFELADEASDSIDFRIIPVNSSGERNLNFSGARTELITDLPDANEFPFIEIEMDFLDEENMTPPQFKYIQIEYEKPADLLVTVASTDTVEAEEGEDIMIDLIVYNPTETEIQNDSIEISANLVRNDGSTGSIQLNRIGKVPPQDTLKTMFLFESIDFGGLNNLQTSVNSNELELYQFNNSTFFEDLIQVNTDSINPVLDVTFDGKYILDGDIVSPNPEIHVVMKDDNQFLFSDSRENLAYTLENEEGRTIPLDSSEFVPASKDNPLSMTLRPRTPLQDGTYTLIINGEDARGNNAFGEGNYEISFEVINESTITHFYPYPNPFSTSCRFVFTLTGSKIPDRLKIQIMTISGRVVKEIDRFELGSINIGNNISEYAWDGTDEFGDKLANGVYLYRVVMEDDTENFKHRSTSADRAFKNGFGKLYILR